MKVTRSLRMFHLWYRGNDLSKKTSNLLSGIEEKKLSCETIYIVFIIVREITMS